MPLVWQILGAVFDFHRLRRERTCFESPTWNGTRYTHLGVLCWAVGDKLQWAIEAYMDLLLSIEAERTSDHHLRAVVVAKLIDSSDYSVTRVHASTCDHVTIPPDLFAKPLNIDVHVPKTA